MHSKATILYNEGGFSRQVGFVNNVFEQVDLTAINWKKENHTI